MPLAVVLGVAHSDCLGNKFAQELLSHLPKLGYTRLCHESYSDQPTEEFLETLRRSNAAADQIFKHYNIQVTSNGVMEDLTKYFPDDEDQVRALRSAPGKSIHYHMISKWLHNGGVVCPIDLTREQYAKFPHTYFAATDINRDQTLAKRTFEQYQQSKASVTVIGQMHLKRIIQEFSSRDKLPTLKVYSPYWSQGPGSHFIEKLVSQAFPTQPIPIENEQQIPLKVQAVLEEIATESLRICGYAYIHKALGVQENLENEPKQTG